MIRIQDEKYGLPAENIDGKVSGLDRIDKYSLDIPKEVGSGDVEVYNENQEIGKYVLDVQEADAGTDKNSEEKYIVER